jgi:hypothetical protein
MSSIEFPEWWKEFMRYHIKDNDNGKSMMNELKWTLNGYSTEKQNSFINHLIAENELENCRRIDSKIWWYLPKGAVAFGFIKKSDIKTEID